MKTTEKIKELANAYFGRENHPSNNFRNLEVDSKWNNWRSVLSITEDYLFLSSLLAKKEMIVKDVTNQDIKLEGPDGLFDFIEGLMDNYFIKLENPKEYCILNKLKGEGYSIDFINFGPLFRSVLM